MTYFPFRTGPDGAMTPSIVTEPGAVASIPSEVKPSLDLAGNRGAATGPLRVGP